MRYSSCACIRSTLTLVRPGSWVSLDVITFVMVRAVDFLCIHEGSSTWGRLIGKYSGSALEGQSVYGRDGAFVHEFLT